jgi:oligopeptidase B
MPPLAAKKPHRMEIHGDVRVDDYFWLREKTNPNVIAYLEAENAYTNDQIRDWQPLRESLYAEMVGRLEEDDSTVPAPRGTYLYYSRTEKGRQHHIYCRRLATGGFEQILLDGNALAEGQKYWRLGAFAISPDQNLLAYSDDTEGDEIYTLRVKNLVTGELLADILTGTAYSGEWASDNRTLLYTTLDEQKRPHRVWKHVLGTPQTADELIYEEDDERFNVGVGKSRSGEWLIIDTASSTTGEVRLLPAARPDAPLLLLLRREPNIEYDIAHSGDWLFIRINDRGRNFRLVRVPVSTPWREHWQEVIPHSEAVKIEAAGGFRTFVEVHERENGLNYIRLLETETLASHRIETPESVGEVGPGTNYVYDTLTYRLEYASLVTPESVFDYDVTTRSRVLKKQTVVHHYDASQFETYRLFAKAPDGTQVPILMVHHKDIARDGSTPTMLYGYGSYGINMEPSFRADRLCLLERGWIWAIAQVRGGAEMGEKWHDDGKFLTKRNTFTDFVACAEYLIAERYTSPAKLTMMGRSAGGMLMGTVLNLRPDLFHAAVAGVPFVDVVSTMLDATLPLTVGEYEEWGNPNDRTYYEYMKSYSPYDNVRKQEYPHLLVTAGLNDPRVQYWEPAKWVAKLRRLKTDDHLLLLKTEMGAGHFGPSGRYERFKELALEYAFLLKTNSLA